MNKLLVVIVIAISATGVYVATRPPAAELASVENSSSPSPSPSPVESPVYDIVSQGRAGRSDGNPFSFSTYLTMDGAGIRWEVERRANRRLAEAELQKRVLTYSSLLEDGPMLGKNAEVVGRRVIAQKTPQTGDAKITIIIWNAGDAIKSIQSNSMKAALEFEKR